MAAAAKRNSKPKPDEKLRALEAEATALRSPLTDSLRDVLQRRRPVFDGLRAAMAQGQAHAAEMAKAGRRIDQALARETGLLAPRSAGKKTPRRPSPAEVVAAKLFPNRVPPTMTQSEAIKQLADKMKSEGIAQPGTQTLRRVIKTLS